MIEFFKERKIIIIIAILGITLVGWKIYDSLDTSEIETQELPISKEENNESEEKEIIVVHITGEVKKPGVVKIEEGSRMEDIIEKAGGFTENADITDVNLAYVVEDGIKIRIPSYSDKEKEYISEDSGKSIIISDNLEDINTSKENRIVNINTATQSEFEQLPGIGPSISSKIIEYRNQNGKFKNTEDIKNVTGIGENKYAKIKDYIKVK